VISHSAILLAVVAIWPFYALFVEDSFFGDTYVPFLFVPGWHIYGPTYYIMRLKFPLSSSLLDSRVASVLSVVIIPSIVGMLVGACQWYVVGGMIDRYGKTFRRIIEANE
jgi:hypothetical protein